MKNKNTFEFLTEARKGVNKLLNNGYTISEIFRYALDAATEDKFRKIVEDEKN